MNLRKIMKARRKKPTGFDYYADSCLMFDLQRDSAGALSIFVQALQSQLTNPPYKDWLTRILRATDGENYRQAEVIEGKGVRLGNRFAVWYTSPHGGGVEDMIELATADPPTTATVGRANLGGTTPSPYPMGATFEGLISPVGYPQAVPRGVVSTPASGDYVDQVMSRPLQLRPWGGGDVQIGPTMPQTADFLQDDRSEAMMADNRCWHTAQQAIWFEFDASPPIYNVATMGDAGPRIFDGSPIRRCVSNELSAIAHFDALGYERRVLTPDDLPELPARSNRAIYYQPWTVWETGGQPYSIGTVWAVAQDWVPVVSYTDSQGGPHYRYEWRSMTEIGGIAVLPPAGPMQWVYRQQRDKPAPTNNGQGGITRDMPAWSTVPATGSPVSNIVGAWGDTLVCNNGTMLLKDGVVQAVAGAPSLIYCRFLRDHGLWLGFDHDLDHTTATGTDTCYTSPDAMTWTATPIHFHPFGNATLPLTGGMGQVNKSTGWEGARTEGVGHNLLILRPMISLRGIVAQLPDAPLWPPAT